MNNFQNPRHIRDIAHLYISRLASKDDVRPVQVYVVAETRGCFGAYHAVNIALGFAHDRYAVQLFEVSDVLPCCAYYLRLPPRVYLKHKVQSPAESLSALGGITVRFAAPPESAFGQNAARVVVADPPPRSPRAVDVYHLPPASDEDSLKHALDNTRVTTGAPGGDRARAVVLAADETAANDIGERVFGGYENVDWITAALNGGLYGWENAANKHAGAGYIAGWRPLLSDPVPCMVRDPQSRVSRSYIAVCKLLLSQGSYIKGEYGTRKPQRAASLGQIR